MPGSASHWRRQLQGTWIRCPSTPNNLITFRKSRRRREMYSGHARLCVCLSVRGRMPTLLRGPGCNLGNGRGCPPSCVLSAGFAIGARVALLWQHSANVKYQPVLVLAMCLFFMAALYNRAGHYIFALWFLLSIFYHFSSPNLSGRRVDIYHTSTHGVALVRI